MKTSATVGGLKPTELYGRRDAASSE